MLVGASGQVTVSPVGVEPESDIGPAKLSTLVRDTEIVLLLPEFRSIGVMVIAKSPT